MSTEFEREFMGELGFDVDDPTVAAALEDAEAHTRLIETLVGLRDLCALSQTAVAERMGTTQSRVSSFERLGGDPRLSTILRYARAVDAKVKLAVSVAPRGWDLTETRKVTQTPIEGAARQVTGDWEPVTQKAVAG